MKRTAVIMAGGSGERFWPLSRIKKPKQLLPLASDKTMLEESIYRISPLIPPEDVFIITSQILLEPMRKALPQLPAENIIAEPAKRNTAPCLALSAAFIAERYSEDGSMPDNISIAVLTADQSIEPNEGFVKTVDSILDYVENNPVLATIGIQPNRPETGYGYIQVNEPFDINKNDTEIKQIICFVEKPDIVTAEKYLESGKFLWNSGMFFWQLDHFIEAMKTHLPEVGGKITDIKKYYHKKTHFALPEALDRITPIFEKFPNISIDYGIMEKVSNAVVAKAMFNWDDIGSWDSLDRLKNSDIQGNIIEGASALFDINNSVIINASSNSKTVIAGFGFEKMVIVVTDDAVLFCPKDRVQEVKKCVEMLQKNNGKRWL